MDRALREHVKREERGRERVDLLDLEDPDRLLSARLLSCLLRCCVERLPLSLTDKLLCLSGKRIPGPTSAAFWSFLMASLVKRASSCRFCATALKPELIPVDEDTEGIASRTST